MLLLYNGRLHDRSPRHTALAIDDRRIFAVGSDAEILHLYKPGMISFNLEGRYVMPGLTDSHIHLELYGLSLDLVNCATSTPEQCLEQVRARAGQTQPGEWIRGHGWNQNHWGGVFGTATQLDTGTLAHPVFLTDMSLHSAWVNSLALELAGINITTPDPVGGLIQRDADGKPSGILFENAVNLVEKIIPALNSSRLKQNLHAAQQNLHKFGITAVHDFDRLSCFRTLQELDQAGELTLRVIKGLPVDQLQEAVDLDRQGGFASSHLCIGPVKMFADGALGPQTAAMLLPYEGKDTNCGKLLLKAAEILENGRLAGRFGLPLAVHAIGDAATREVLNGFALLRTFEEENKLPHLPHRIEHMQLLSPEDLGRAASLGIWASMQPVHLYQDMKTADRKWGSRARYAYAHKTLLSYKTNLLFGSDAPVESPNPFWGMHAAINRVDRNAGDQQEPWYPEECISLHKAIRGYIINPALQTGQQPVLGSLAAGKMADLLVLGQDPFLIPPRELYTIKPDMVMVDGKWVVHSDL